MAATHWLGVDLGGTKILAGLFDAGGTILARHKVATRAEEGGEAVMGRISAAVAAVLREAKVEAGQVAGMGMGMPGQITPGTHTIRYAPNLNWREFDLTPLLPPEWTWPLVLENDVRMGTYGEWAYGAAKGSRHVFGVFAGTGVGGGLILNGELYNGFNGHAGEVGHIILNWRRGRSLEKVAGRRWIMERARKLLGGAPKRVRKTWKGVDLAAIKSSLLADLYRADDPVAHRLIDDAALALGAAVGGVVNLLSPEVVVIGGGVMEALGDPFLERIWEVAQRYTLPRAAENVRCVRAALGDDAGIIGASAFARRRLLNPQ